MKQEKLPSFLKDMDSKTATWLLYGLCGGAAVFHFLLLLAAALWYVKHEQVRATIYESHFEWLLRTFAAGVALALIAALAVVLSIGWVLPVAGIAFGLWGVFRLVKGVLRLAENRALENPKALL